MEPSEFDPISSSQVVIVKVEGTKLEPGDIAFSGITTPSDPYLAITRGPGKMEKGDLVHPGVGTVLECAPFLGDVSPSSHVSLE